MSFRTVYGNEWSEKGWRMCNRDECDIVRIPGLTLVDTAPLRKGPPLIILGAWLFWYDRNVEEITSPVWGWSETNAVGNSNHLAGVAVDINAPKYPWGARVMPADRIAKVREGLRLFKGSVYWGEDWDRADQMHYDMSWPENDTRNGYFANELLNGYLGIYGSAPPLSDTDQVALLIIGAARSRGYSRDDTIACLATGIQESGLNQNATDSTGHRGVFQQDGGYPNRETTAGNVGGFFDRLDAKRASAGASQNIWLNIFWLQQRPGESSADAAYAHGRQKYLTEIQSRIPAATDYYNRLATTSDEGFLMALTDAEQRELLDLARQIAAYRRDSRSPFRRVGEHNIDTALGLTLNTDGNVHALLVQSLAKLGDPDALALLAEVAGLDPNQYPDRLHDKRMAQAVLNDIANTVTPGSAPPSGKTPGAIPSSPPPFIPPTPELPNVSNPAPLQPIPLPDEKDTGDIIADLYRSLDRLRLADSMPIEARAPMQALISVLQTKNGTQL